MLFQLRQHGRALTWVAPHGDCFVLAGLASSGEITPEDAIHPPPTVLARVTALRNAAIDIVCGDAPIGGIPAAVFRTGERLPADPTAAEAEMAPWRALGHWEIEGEEWKSPLFMFGIALALGRRIVVLERRGTTYLNPASVYAAEMPDGSLRCSMARGSQPATVSSYYHAAFDDVLTSLLGNRPPLLVEFDGINHHRAFVSNADAVTEEEDATPDDRADAPVAAPDGAHVAAPAGAPDGAPVAAPASTELTDAYIEARMAQLEVRWEDEEQLTLLGTDRFNAIHHLTDLQTLLDRMGVDAISLLTADRTYHFVRSEYGDRRLNITTEEPGGDDDEERSDEEGHGEDGVEDRLGMPVTGVAYAAANLEGPPGGENPVAEQDQQHQLAEEDGAGAALAEGIALAEPAGRDEVPMASRGQERPKAKRKRAVVVAPPPPPAGHVARTGRVSRPAARFDDEAASGVGSHAYHSTTTLKDPAPNVDELGVPDFAVVGARVKAQGWAGVTKTFEATVVAIRDRFPRIRVRYVKDIVSGETLPLALPQPQEAYLHAGAIDPL